MFIAGASATLRRLLEDQLIATGGLDGYDVSLFSTRHFTGSITNRVALFLYRVEVDEARRNIDLPRLPFEILRQKNHICSSVRIIFGKLFLLWSFGNIKFTTENRN